MNKGGTTRFRPLDGIFFYKGSESMNFELPQKEHEQMFKDFVSEAHQNGETTIHGDGCCSLYEDFEEWLRFDKNLRNGKNIPDGYVEATTYFVIEDHQMIGTVNIRHLLNDSLLQRGGHVGYSVLVSRRRQGIATQILKFAIQECHKMGIKDILVTCQKENIASKKTIEKCGGQLENILKVNDDEILRYWIKGEEEK